MKNYDVLIIGGGAAGLACAVRLKELNKNLSVAILEAGERLGKKIAATGNGQGNLSNANLLPQRYHGTCAPLATRLIRPDATSPFSLFDFLTITDGKGRIYPASKQGSAISDCLIKRVSDSGIDVFCSSPVVGIGSDLTVRTANGTRFSGKRVLLATGGKAQKQFRTDGSAYSLATALGHTLTPLYPSLVQLKCTGGFKQLKGIRTECKVTVFNAKKEKLVTTEGDVIFTDYGLSGNAIFYASAYCAGETGVTLSVEFLPEVPLQDIAAIIERRQGCGYAECEWLGGTLHNALGRELIKRCADKTPSGIARFIKAFPVAVEGSLGWDYAQVTHGGIPLAEVTAEAQSKKVCGLYFAGEILDVDGDCGGYNLHFAFASGIFAAECINRSIVRGQRYGD